MNDSAIKICLVGTCFTDIKGFPFEKYDPVGRNIGKIEYHSGGVARNVALNCANMGYVVKFISMADSGGSGDDMLEELHAAGADISDVLRPARGGSGVWMAVMNDDGDVAGSISQQPDLDMLESHIRSLGGRVTEGCGALLLEIDLNEAVAEYCIGLAETAGVPVYAIVGNMSVACARKDLLARCRCFICNRAEAEKLFGHSLEGDMEALRDEVALNAVRMDLPQLVVTLGGGGSVWFDRSSEQTGFVPPLETDVVDTTGAGDAFFSACVCALLEGRPLDEACRAGTALASRVISSRENACRSCADFIRNREYM